MNQELREQLAKHKHMSQENVNKIYNTIIKDKNLMNMFSHASMEVLNKLKDLTPNLEQLLDHQNTMLGLFINKGEVNNNCAEVNQNC